MISEQYAVTTRGTASVISTIVGAISFFGRVSVIVTLKEIFEVFESLDVKVASTVMYIIQDVFLGKRI